MAELLHLTIGKLLEKTAADAPDHEAVVYPDRGLRYTYREFDQLCRKVAKGLMALGIDKGEHVAIWASNTPEWLTAQFASAKAGAVLVTANTNYQLSELEYVLKQSDATTLILMESYRGTSYIDILCKLIPELKEGEPGRLASERLPFLKNIILLGDQRHPGMYLWDDLLKLSGSVSEKALDRRMERLKEHDVINMQYTSGTTGFPKGVMLTHSNLANNAANIAECMNLSKKTECASPFRFSTASAVYWGLSLASPPARRWCRYKNSVRKKCFQPSKRKNARRFTVYRPCSSPN